MIFKSGYVNIVGLPNVGKSTLMNYLLGIKIAAESPKKQTTRKRMLGIYNDPAHQIVFSDTPGWIAEPKNLLQEKMNQSIHQAKKDADLLMLTTAVKQQKKNDWLLDFKSNNHCFLVINKIDLSNPEEVKREVDYYQSLLEIKDIFCVCALHRFGKELLFDYIKNKLPQHPAYFDKDQITDKSYRFIIAEIIRERLYFHYRNEIPYAAEVAIVEYKKQALVQKVKAIIFVEKQSQLAILIGSKGYKIKMVGVESRKKIEAFIGHKIMLEIRVKVKSQWRNEQQSLKNFNYI